MSSAASSHPISGGQPASAARHSLPARLWRAVVNSDNTYRLLTLLVIAVAWQLLAINAGGLLIPSFTDTVVALVELLFDPVLWQALLISNQAMVIGFAISVVIGIPLGLAMGRFRAAEQFSDVYLNILLVTPISTLIPLLVMSVGIGLAARIILVVFFTFIMIIVNSRAGVRQVDPSLIEMGRSFGASERQLWQRIILPGAMPAVMAGIRIGLSRAVQGMVIVELLMVSVGVGGLILRYRGFFQADRLYAVIVVIVIEALILIALARWVERRVVPWAPSTSKRATSGNRGATR
jgi:ABC-type nitrate/sulfonate/bicarbonate transport system permease component